MLSELSGVVSPTNGEYAGGVTALFDLSLSLGGTYIKTKTKSGKG